MVAPPLFTRVAHSLVSSRGGHCRRSEEMSRTLVQPVGQKRLTNVAVVRLRKHDQRFEIACFPNKVLSWRSRIEKDIDEVLQSHTDYSNVSKGVLAKSKDLVKAFGTDDQTQICIEVGYLSFPLLLSNSILNRQPLPTLDAPRCFFRFWRKGSSRSPARRGRRSSPASSATWPPSFMEKTINPETPRPYTITMIERLMHEIHFAIDPNLTSKEQVPENTSHAYLLQR